MKAGNNASLIVGISIPFVMIALVAISIYVPGRFAPQAKFNFLYAADGGDVGYFQYAVDRGKLMAPTSVYPNLRRMPQFFVHDVASNRSHEVSLEEAQRLSLNSEAVSPDGWEMAYGGSGGGVFPFYFYNHYDYGAVYLKGHHTSRKLNLQPFLGSHYSYYSVHFLGWLPLQGGA